jgi:hypothetical protein
VIGLLGSAIAGSLATAWLAVRHPDPLVERVEAQVPAPRSGHHDDG